MALSSGAALPLIAQYESGNQNIANVPLPGAAPSTASGYYQIINGTWQQYAAGVPGASQYPTAMSAPQSVQTQVAAAIYNAQGLGPWSSNAPLVSAITAAGGAPVSDTTGADTAPMGVGGGNAGAAVNQGGGLGTSIIAGVWEVVSRGTLILIGAALVILALAALLFESKTVQTVTGHAAGKVAATVG